MILEASKEDLEIIDKILDEHFHSKLSFNEFSKIYVYKNEEILGFLIFSIIYERAEIDYIYVFEKYRNKKIASKLLDKMFLILNENKVKSVSLEVMIENLSAVSLYKKYGFKEVARREKYYLDKDAYLMMREVD